MTKVDWSAVGYIKRSKNRKDALKLLETPMMPSELGKEMKISLTHASKIVRELNSQSLVKCLNDGLKVGRIYRTTSKGMKVREEAEKYGSDK